MEAGIERFLHKSIPQIIYTSSEEIYEAVERIRIVEVDQRRLHYPQQHLAVP